MYWKLTHWGDSIEEIMSSGYFWGNIITPGETNLTWDNHEGVQTNWIQKIPDSKMINLEPPEIKINETIEFKKNQNIKKSLDLGEYRKIYCPIKKEDLLPGYYIAAEKSNFEIDYMKFSVGEEGFQNIINLSSNIFDSPEFAKKDPMNYTNYPWAEESFVEAFNKSGIYIQKIANIDESLQFQKGEDPKKSLDLGIWRKIYKPTIENWKRLPSGYYLINPIGSVGNWHSPNVFNIAYWNEKKEIYRISGKIIRTRNITQTAVCRKNGWTTVLAAAIFVL